MLYSKSAGVLLGQLVGYAYFYAQAMGKEPDEVLEVCLAACVRQLKHAWITRHQEAEALLNKSVEDALTDPQWKTAWGHFLKAAAERTAQLSVEATCRLATGMNANTEMQLNIKDMTENDRASWRQEIQAKYAHDPAERDKLLEFLDRFFARFS